MRIKNFDLEEEVELVFDSLFLKIMHTLGKPLGTAGAIEYFKDDIRNQTQEDKNSRADKSLSENKKLPEILESIQKKKNENEGGSDGSSEDIILGESISFWQGELAKEFGLAGNVKEEAFNRLCRGQHPLIKEQLIRHVKPRKLKKKKKDKDGNISTIEYYSKSHRAGINHSVSAPKSVSLVAMLDPRVILAHHNAEIKASNYVEKFTSAKMGGSNPSERTGCVLNASFLQFEARPDSKTGKTAPTLHTQSLEFNLSKTKDGKFRAIETRESLRSQKLKTALYRSYLIPEMEAIGYQMRIDSRTKAPEVRGISREYIEVNSPRQNEIIEKAEELGIKSTDVVSSNYRRKKIPDKAEMIRQFNENEKEFGFPVAKAVAKAKDRSRDSDTQTNQNLTIPQESIKNSDNDYQKQDKITEGQAFEAVIKEAEKHFEEKGTRKFTTEQNLLAEVLNHSLRDLKIEKVEKEFANRQTSGELNIFKFSRTSQNGEESTNHSKEISKNSLDTENQPNHSKNQLHVELENSNERNVRRVKTEQDGQRVSKDEKQLVSKRHSQTANNNGESNLASLFNRIKSKNRKFDKEESQTQKTFFSVVQTSGGKSGESLEKIEFTGEESAAIRNDRADNQTNGSGERTEFNSSEIKTNVGRNSAKGSDSGGTEQTQIEFGVAEDRNLEERDSDDRTQEKAQIGRTSENRTRIERNSDRASQTQELEENGDRENRQEFQHSGQFGVGESDRDKSISFEDYRESIPQLGTEANRDKELRGRDSGFSERDREDKTRSQKTRKGLYEEDRSSTQNDALLDSSTNSDNDHIVLQYDDQREANRERDVVGRNNIQSEKISGSVGREFEAGARKHSKHDSSFERTVADGQELLQETADREEQDKRNNVEKNPRAAEWATQIINVKFYGGQLDKEVTDKWAMIIKDSSAPEEFLNELTQTKTPDQREELSRNLDQQLEILTESFNLPKKNLSGVDIESHLTQRLSKIEVKNFEEISGEKISSKTIEILSKSKSELKNNLSTEDHIEKSTELFGDALNVEQVFNTELEYKVFEGLLYPHAVGFDEEIITETQRDVDRDEYISREIVDLIQLSYGGQCEVFTDEFKLELSDKIYYLPTEPSDIYDKIYQENWQRQIEMFSPIVEHTAEQMNININTPQNELQRNQQLSEFITQQMMFAYEQFNKQKLNDDIVNELHKGILNLSEKSPTDIQLNRITEYKNSELNLPAFETSLDIFAYKSLNQTDEERSEVTEKYATKINEIREEQANQIRLENLTKVREFENDNSYDDGMDM